MVNKRDDVRSASTRTLVCALDYSYALLLIPATNFEIERVFLDDFDWGGFDAG